MVICVRLMWLPLARSSRRRSLSTWYAFIPPILYTYTYICFLAPRARMWVMLLFIKASFVNEFNSRIYVCVCVFWEISACCVCVYKRCFKRPPGVHIYLYTIYTTSWRRCLFFSHLTTFFLFYWNAPQRIRIVLKKKKKRLLSQLADSCT